MKKLNISDEGIRRMAQQLKLDFSKVKENESEENTTRITLPPDPTCVRLLHDIQCGSGSSKAIYLEENKREERITPEMEDARFKKIEKPILAGWECPFGGEPAQTDDSWCSDYYPKRG